MRIIPILLPFLLFSISCFLCESCTQTVKTITNNHLREIEIKTNLSYIQKVNLSTVASNIEYCVLENDKKCLVTPEMSIYCSKDYIVTIGLQRPSQGVCYVFERKTGKFVRQISSQGRGPGEYLETISSFWDGDKEQICMWNGNKYLFYNLNGTLSHQINRFSQRTMGGFVAHKDYYAGYVKNLYGNATIRLAFYDKSGILIDSIPNYRCWERTKSTPLSGSLDHWLYVFNDNLYFKELYCDTLYQIKDFMLHPCYIFNTGGLTVPYEMQTGGGRYDVLAQIRGGEYDRYEKYVNIIKILEDNKHLYFEIEYRKQIYPAIYDKIEDKLQIMPPVSIPQNMKDVAQLFGFENDLDGGLPFWPQHIISDKEMMCVYTAEELLELDISKITDEKLKNVLNSMNEESNPVITIVTLKE